MRIGPPVGAESPRVSSFPLEVGETRLGFRLPANRQVDPDTEPNPVDGLRSRGILRGDAAEAVEPVEAVARDVERIVVVRALSGPGAAEEGVAAVDVERVGEAGEAIAGPAAGEQIRTGRETGADGISLKACMENILNTVDDSFIKGAPNRALAMALTGGGSNMPMVEALADRGRQR